MTFRPQIARARLDTGTCNRAVLVAHPIAIHPRHSPLPHTRTAAEKTAITSISSVTAGHRANDADVAARPNSGYTELSE